MQQGEVWIQNPLEETHQYIKLKDFQVKAQSIKSFLGEKLTLFCCCC